jgi:hypothetical protein
MGRKEHEPPMEPWAAELTVPGEPSFVFPTTRAALDVFVEHLPWASILEDEAQQA